MPSSSSSPLIRQQAQELLDSLQEDDESSLRVPPRALLASWLPLIEEVEDDWAGTQKSYCDATPVLDVLREVVKVAAPAQLLSLYDAIYGGTSPGDVDVLPSAITTTWLPAVMKQCCGEATPEKGLQFVEWLATRTKGAPIAATWAESSECPPDFSAPLRPPNQRSESQRILQEALAFRAEGEPHTSPVSLKIGAAWMQAWDKCSEWQGPNKIDSGAAWFEALPNDRDQQIGTWTRMAMLGFTLAANKPAAAAHWYPAERAFPDDMQISPPFEVMHARFDPWAPPMDDQVAGLWLAHALTAYQSVKMAQTIVKQYPAAIEGVLPADDRKIDPSRAVQNDCSRAWVGALCKGAETAPPGAGGAHLEAFRWLCTQAKEHQRPASIWKGGLLKCGSPEFLDEMHQWFPFHPRNITTPQLVDTVREANLAWLINKKLLTPAGAVQLVRQSTKATPFNALKGLPWSAQDRSMLRLALVADTPAIAPRLNFLIGEGIKPNMATLCFHLNRSGKDSRESVEVVARALANGAEPRAESDGSLGYALSAAELRQDQEGYADHLLDNRQKAQALAQSGMRLTAADRAELEKLPPNTVARTAVMGAAILEIPGATGIKAFEENPAVKKIQAIASYWRDKLNMEVPSGLIDQTPYGVRPAVYKTVRSWFDADRAAGGDHVLQGWTDPRSAAVPRDRYARNLAVLFGTTDRVERYLGTHFPDTERSIALNEAAQLELPEERGWNIAAWGDTCLKHGPAMARYVKFATAGEPAPISRAEAYSRYGLKTYKRGAENPTLAALCCELEIDEEDFDAAADAQTRVCAETSKHVPDVTVPGERFGLPGYIWHKATPGDPRILFAGELVNCCQHIGGAAEEAARHSATSPYGACYFLEKPAPKDAPEATEVVAVSWAWRSADDTLCFDSIEAVGPSYRKHLPLLVVALREEVIKSHPGVTKLTVGTGGGTPHLNLLTVAGANAAEPSGLRGTDIYRDSETQYVLRTPDIEADKRIAQRLTALASTVEVTLYAP